MNHQLIESTLSNLRDPFVIHSNGSIQTNLNNTGRVGFYVESLFGILPNNSKTPDFGHTELKTLRVGGSMSIGTMTETEHRRILNRDLHYFATSDPYKKVQNTLLVVYEKLSSRPEPVYVMRNWHLFSLDDLSLTDRNILQSDYSSICEAIKRRSTSRDTLTSFLMNNGSLSGNYLTLGYKGNGYSYNYPVWIFKSSFIKKLKNA